jgi:hypothetical protein
LDRTKKQISWKLSHEIRLPLGKTRFLYFYYKNVDGSKSAAKEELKSEKSLCKRAVQGDSDAFQKLISIDPRYLCSDLGLYFVTHWRYGLMQPIFQNIRLDFDEFESHVDEIESVSPTLFRTIKSDLALQANNKRNYSGGFEASRAIWGFFRK